MCDQHWGMVPKPIQRAVLATCRGARDAPNRARAIAAAIGAVALQEGQPISQRQALAAFDYGVRHERELFRRAELEGMHLTRLGRAEDIAWAIVYLASRESEFVTGALLPIDGGGTIARGKVLG